MVNLIRPIVVMGENIETILSYYAPDAVDMGYNNQLSIDQPTRSKEIQSYLAGIELKSMNNTTEDVVVSSSVDLGFTRGTSHYNKITPDGLIESSDKWVTADSGACEHLIPVLCEQSIY